SNLRVPSPIDGRVISWEIKRLLTNKPVRWGEALMNVADEEGTWRLVFKAPEHRIGYILDAATDSEEPLTLEYSFDSDPGQKYGATISTIAKSTDFDSQLGPFVIIECLPDSQNFPKRHGAKVYASVKCGERSVLFIWTHELVDSIRRQFVW
ncbi:MAG: HlyD family efflux transporter periplasmic adaptor subunit, partial [Pirellulaceae bacterium]|nr:HlyD family efflux transporter periplasmic adaptor subunit [Pirellulaceae bacterium]